jgi:lambda family phage portal protein
VPSDVRAAAKILGPNGRPYQARPPRASQVPARRIRAKYDAAQTTDENRRHWANSDGLSARAANSPDVRQRLRERARYEADQNNSYAWGIVKTLVNDTIGTGPRLQLLTEDDDANRRIELAFAAWSNAIGLAVKLRTMCRARVVDGETFGLLATNPRLDSPVQLDLRLVEADQVATPQLDPLDPRAVDGITFDSAGNPIAYDVLREHPGDLGTFGGIPFGESDRVPARLVLHWFQALRPGQARGVPEITPALPLFALLRRYTLATVTAAEIAALFAALLKSNFPPEEGDEALPPFDTQEIERGMMTALPDGYDFTQLKAEQPTTTYPDFKREILNEIARCLNMPFNVAAGNSSGYNYSSGRLDHQVYYKSLRVDQSHAELVILDRLFRAWLDEASKTMPGLLPGGPDRLEGWPHQWFWDGQEHVDPQKEALAQETRLKNRTTTYAHEYARQGRDWETAFDQIAKEQERMRQLGIEVAPAAPGPGSAPQPEFQPVGEDDGDQSDA